jgi:hypothetical protein
MKHTPSSYQLIQVALIFWLIGGPFLAEAAQPNYDQPLPSAKLGIPKTIVNS